MISRPENPLLRLAPLVAAGLSTFAVGAAVSKPVEVDLDPPRIEDILPPEGSVAGLLVGSALLESGDVESALSYYRFLFRADPRNRLLAERYLDVALRAGRPGEALETVNRLLEDGEDPEWMVEKVRLLLMLDRAEEAEPIVARLRELEPEDSEAVELQISVWIRLQRWDDAQAALEARLLEVPENAYLHRRLAELRLRAGDAEGAEAEFRESLRLDPSDSQVVDQLSELLAPDRLDELRSILESFVGANPDAAVQAARLADLYLSAGQPEDAVDVLVPLVRRGLLEDRAEVVLAQLLESMGRGEEAVAILQERAESAVVPSAARQRLLGELQAEAGRVDVAREHFERALTLDPDEGETYASYLLLLSSPAGESESEEQAASRRQRLEEVAALAPARVSPRSLRQNFLVGAVLSRLGEHSEALPLLERATEIAPDDRRALYELALTQEQLERDKEAALTLERLLELDPEDPEILNFYGYLLAENGWQLERAEKAVRKALAAQPRNGAYLDSLGWVYFQQERYEDALDWIVDASNVLGDDPVILEHLGDCLRKLERWDDAAAAYRRAIQVGGDPERLEPRLQEVRDELSRQP